MRIARRCKWPGYDWIIPLPSLVKKPGNALGALADISSRADN